MSELLRQPTRKAATESGAKGGISQADAVRLVVNTAVAMAEHEPAIDVRSVEESRRGAGILIWIPGYVSNGETIVLSEADAPVETVEEQ